MSRYIINFRQPDGDVGREYAETLLSMFGKVAHLAHDFKQIWVRENPGGAIIVVYDPEGCLQRPTRTALSASVMLRLDE